MAKSNHLKFLDELNALLNSYSVDIMRPSLDGKRIEFISNGYNLTISKYDNGYYVDTVMEIGDYTPSEVKRNEG